VFIPIFLYYIYLKMGLKAEISNKQIVKTGKFQCQKLVLRGCKILGNRFPDRILA